MKRQRTVVDAWFKDERGEWAIMQDANLPILVTIGLSLVAAMALLINLMLAKFLGISAVLAFVYWSWLEITSGTNYFRRLLGWLGLLTAVVSGVYIVLH